MIVDRITERSKIKDKDREDVYISSYEVIEKITEDVVTENSDLVNDITLGEIPESALETKIMKIINRYNFKVVGKTRKELVKDITHNVFGYGPIQRYIDIKDCNGVFINGPDNVWVKIGSKLERVDISFGSNKNLTHYIRAIAAKLRREINENKALVKLEDNENKLRIIASIQPVSHISPTVVFRKHRGEAFTLDDLIQIGMLTKELTENLKTYMKAGANIVVCGRGGAGKTTLLRALLEEVEEHERMLVMEEHAEFFLKHPGAIQMIVKRNEKGHVTNLAELTDMGLLMTIDRYVFGEIRGSESMPFFNGAFAGNITASTMHSKSARHAVKKMMINMKMLGTDIKDNVLLDMLYESIDIIIHMDAFTVAEVVEIIPEREDKFNTLWRFNVSRREATFVEGKHEKVNDIESEELKRKLSERNLLKE